MSRPAPITPTRRFFRGLARTCLWLLLPVLSALCWLVHLDRPARLPGFIGDRLAAALSTQGVQVRARAFWIQPDLSLAADDLTIAVDGLSGDIFEAARLEAALHPGSLLSGEVALTQLRLSGGRVWCPAALARDGVRRRLVDELSLDLAREGRWFQLRNAQVRSGKVTCRIVGELPVQSLRFDQAAEGTRSRRLAAVLADLENAGRWAERSSGASVTARCAGQADGRTELSLAALLEDDWIDPAAGRIRAHAPRLSGVAQIGADGRVGKWRLSGEARDLAWGGWSARRAELAAEGADAGGGELRLALSAVNGGGVFLPRITLRAEEFLKPTKQATYRLTTDASWAIGSLSREADGSFAIHVEQAAVAAAELATAPMIGPALREARVALTGEVLLRGISASLTREGAPRKVSGEIAASGFRGLGLSAEAIAPTEGQPLRTRFDYEPERLAAPLLLRDLRLASVRGEADLEPRAGGAFRLNLRGDLAPASLDVILGKWWVDLWRDFTLTERPHAFIEVSGHWGAETGVTKGRVRLRRFEFLGAPFRRVEVSVDADPRRTFIGLHGLAGGTSEADGSVDGTATWDWSKPVALAGPVIRLEGDLQPWIAARCGGAALGETLRGLELPAARRLSLELSPGESAPILRVRASCEGPFIAWGVRGEALQAEVTDLGKGQRVSAHAGFAGGQAVLELAGDPLSRTKVELGLVRCDPAVVGAMFAGTPPLESASPQNLAPKNRSRLDLAFSGEVDFKDLKMARGRGRYALEDSELRKVRLLGGVSSLLEALGVGATTYELTQAKGSFGCLDGRAYFPDMAITGPQARLDLVGELDLKAATLDFEGDFSLPRKQGFDPIDIINLNRALVSLAKIKLTGPLAKPETRNFATLKDIIKPQQSKDLGKIPPSLSE